MRSEEKRETSHIQLLCNSSFKRTSSFKIAFLKLKLKPKSRREINYDQLSVIEQACSVKIAGYWPKSCLLHFMDQDQCIAYHERFCTWRPLVAKGSFSRSYIQILRNYASKIYRYAICMACWVLRVCQFRVNWVLIHQETWALTKQQDGFFLMI